MSENWVQELQDKLRAFAEARDWERYHTPQNLAALIASEAGELLALFRWGQDSVSERPDEVAHEVADVFLAVLRFADVAGIDLEGVAQEKIRVNERNYPVSKRRLPDKVDESGRGNA